MISEPFKI